MILSGYGSTAVWNDAGQRITFEWKAGALFAIPVNAWHQHFNGSGREPARYVAVTETLLEQRRLLFVAPTGGGKSLVYQLPAVFAHGHDGRGLAAHRAHARSGRGARAARHRCDVLWLRRSPLTSSAGA